MTEGFTNAAYALEKMGNTEKAIKLYKQALKKFPGEAKIVVPYVNTLQVWVRLVSPGP
jgi:hypothetical protein